MLVPVLLDANLADTPKFTVIFPTVVCPDPAVTKTDPEAAVLIRDH